MKIMTNLRNVVAVATYLAVTAVFTGCDKEEKSPSTPFNGNLSGTIEGKHASWDSVVVTFDFRSAVKVPIIDGKFTFSPLPTPSSEQLQLVSLNYQNFEISDADAKVGTAHFMASQYRIYPNGVNESIVHRAPSSNPTITVEYIYADRNVKIKGSISGTIMGVEVKSEIDVNLKQGWNTILSTVSEEKGLTTVIQKNGVPPSNAVWRWFYEQLPADN
jgi:hypothetical protein